MKELQTEIRPQWCPGCTYFADLQAVYKTFVDMGFDETSLVVVGGIGCTGRITSYINLYTIHTLHGRPLPVALGFKLSNPSINVVVISGDGDLLSIGGTHFIHTARKNIDLTVLMFDNFVYGLTKGQVSPTSPHNLVTSTTPQGNFDEPVNPISLALVSGATFVAQAFALDVNKTFNIIKEAIKHKGFSFVNILSPCITYYRAEDVKTFKNKIRELEDQYSTDLSKAIYNSTLYHYYTGVFYKVDRPTFDENVLKGNIPLKTELYQKERIKKLLQNYS
ncbi:MAG: 2-oxoacid:ferredoxin oxidoreductase subunit beta [Candidatus Calescibacterium sp.]|nr:2-oxoacid:ferredoxin oxidoreductase subunit beta [Candidatus Calescibacterium sp.]MDW8132047.1 2-oxoacid:ferredoxin oxidoreductase subunit beta [Candidatus Calescibacterium sp.]